MKLGLMSTIRGRFKSPDLGVLLMEAGYAVTLYSRDVELPSGDVLFPIQDSYSVKFKK